MVQAAIRQFGSTVVVRYVLIALLCIAAGISVAQGYRNALHNSQDFQWSGSAILVGGEDPYRIYQEDPESPRFLLVQHPVYLHFTYLMLSPLAFLGFERAKIAWAIANFVFVFGMFALLRRRFSGQVLVIVLLFFLCSTPVRNSIGNGQQSLLCLFLYILAVYFADKGADRLAALFAGLGAFKFSFGIPLVFAFDRNSLKNVIIYGVPTVFGIIFWVVAFHRGLAESALLPFLASQSVGLGAADLLSLLRSCGFSQTISYGVPISLFIVIVGLQKLILPIEDALDRFSLYSLVSLLLVYHSSYDQMFLLGCVLVGACSRVAGVKWTVFLIVAYFWFGLKAISFVTAWAVDHTASPILANNILLWILFGSLAYEFRYGRPRGSLTLESELHSMIGKGSVTVAGHSGATTPS